MTFTCKGCKYSTVKLFNYEKHLKTQKHLQKVGGQIGSPVGPDGSVGGPNGSKNEPCQCEYCGKTISRRRHLNRHYRGCKVKDEDEQVKNRIIKQLQEDRDRLIKQNEQLAKDKEQEIKWHKENAKELMSLMRELTNKPSGETNITNINQYYVRNHFTEAHNYEDLMAKELTEEEIDHARRMGPSAGCERIIINRCIKGMDLEKRPIHCVDLAREKLLLKTKDGWMIDTEMSMLLKPAFDHMRSLHNVAKDNPDVKALSKSLKSLLEMDMNGKKTFRNICKMTHSKQALGPTDDTPKIEVIHK